jgi:hypothetical protein
MATGCTPPVPSTTNGASIHGASISMPTPSRNPAGGPTSADITFQRAGRRSQRATARRSRRAKTDRPPPLYRVSDRPRTARNAMSSGTASSASYSPAWHTPAAADLDRARRSAQSGGRRRQATRLALHARPAQPRLDQAQAPPRRAARGHRRAPTPDGKTEALFGARRLADGSLIGTGPIELGLRPELMQDLDRRRAC